MYRGTQCPKCLSHGHEHFYIEQKTLKWVIDRCSRCHHNFDLEEFKGSSMFFNNRVKYQQNNGINP